MSCCPHGIEKIIITSNHGSEKVTITNMNHYTKEPPM